MVNNQIRIRLTPTTPELVEFKFVTLFMARTNFQNESHLIVSVI